MNRGQKNTENNLRKRDKSIRDMKYRQQARDKDSDGERRSKGKMKRDWRDW